MSEIHGDVMQCIGFIILKYEVLGTWLVWLGGGVILASWLMMFFTREWKHRAWIVVLLLPVGLALFGYGNYNLGFGGRTKNNL